MEYLLVFIAALFAGIGTGLAGLSAATVMVPILIVLCPGFAGETGAYQATAIALASDILGSAVTAYTYAKHGNIDLKRGWIMMACILTLCVAGSYAAWLAGNVVLGGFTLFLTFCIGIRFLIKPDTSREETAVKGEKLTPFQIAVSLFFGVTIGFGTGFVGTGGGMMMLVVFTVFLHMDLKTAVGTSTLIMTFTALIACVSHILIHPAIVMEKWDILLLCMVTATAASLYSARFANRVNNRTAGLVTGAVLTVLGAAMILITYRNILVTVPYFEGTLKCLLDFVLYVIPCVIFILPLRYLTKIPSHVFRKMLHMIAFTCVAVMIQFAQCWQAAALSSLVIAVVLYPLLALLENRSWFGHLLVEKSSGEIKRSFLKLFLMCTAVTAIAWGLFGHREIAAASVLMWGTGDAAAALVGIPYGKHKVHLPHTDGKKSWEGSIAMTVTSAVFGMIFFALFGYPFAKTLCMVLPASHMGAGAELFSSSEADTVTVPLSIMAVLILVFRILS